MKIAIVGVGVAGGVVATGLAHHPAIELLAFERVGPDDHALAGNGLNIGPNALHALDRAMPEMAERLRNLSLPWRQWRASTVQGELLYQIPLSGVAPCDGIRIRWAELYKACRELPAGCIRYQSEKIRILPDDGHGRLALDVVDSSGASATYSDIDMLIASDGRYSDIRSQVCGAGEITYLGVANFRTLLQDHGQWPIDDLEQWFNGPNRLLAFRLRDGLVYLSGNLPLPPGEPIPEKRHIADWLRRSFLPEAADMAAVPRHLLDGAINAARQDDLHWSRLQQTTVQWLDASHRIVFPGDSGHAMVPTLGQGASTAIEDAALLVKMIGTAFENTSCPDPRQILLEYARHRHARIEFVRTFSWQASDVIRADLFSLAAVRAKGDDGYQNALHTLYHDIWP